MYGIVEFASIINDAASSCIVAVGAGKERPFVRRTARSKSPAVMTVTMSADHRVVDGGYRFAKFLQTLKQFIEEPASMLL